MSSALEASVFGKSQYSSLITQERQDGNSHYLVLKEFENGDASLTTIQLKSDEKLGKGGGAKRKNTLKTEMDDDTIWKSVMRARRSVKEKGRQLCCDRMLTLTFRENVEDLEDAWTVFKYFSKLCRAHWGEDWSYIAVPELQKRGAVHFHLALRGFFNVKILRLYWQRAAGMRGGNIDITSPKKFGKNSWNPKRICQYITKYISKSDVVGFNKRRYSSGGKIPPVKKSTGWVALGLPMMKLADEILRIATRKQVMCVFESKEFFGLAYYST